MAPLHTASKKGDLDGVRAALAAGADVNGKDSVRGGAAHERTRGDARSPQCARLRA
jgi:hypothetical protein